MRIGIDIRPLQSSSRERGIGYYIRGLVEGLARVGTGQEYVFLTIAGRPVPVDLGQVLNAECVPLPLEPPGWPALTLVRYLRWLNPAHARQRGMRYDILLRRRWDMGRLASAARQARLDVLHLPSVFEPEYFANVGPEFPCPVVQTVHDLIPEVFPEINRTAGWPFWQMRSAGLRSLAEGQGQVVAISESARADTERFVPASQGRVQVVWNGVNDRFVPQTDAVIAQVATKFSLRSQGYLLTNGGVEWRKNLTTVLAAAAQSALDLPVVVPGRLSEADQALIAQWRGDAGLDENRLIVTGFVPDEDLPALYAGAAAFVFPSRYEGFGLPIIEAMRCRCPVITAHNSSLPEVGGSAMLYVKDAEDVNALVQAMERVVNEPGLADDLRARGAAWAPHFSWEQSAAAYLAIYQRLAAEKTAVVADQGVRSERHVADRI